MEVLYPRCAGLDVHKDSVVACARLAAGPRVEQQVDSFGTTTGELERLRAWLSARGVTHVAMEATGVYWKPVWHVLEGACELVLSPMPRTARTSPAARPTTMMPPGSRIYSPTGSSGRASSPSGPCRSCGR